MRTKITVWILAVSLCLSACSGPPSETTEDVVVCSVNGEEIGLREWNFYMRMNQMQWEKSYLDSYGEDMWSMELDEEGTTLADSLKEEVLDSVCEIHLMNQHAEEYGAALTELEEQELHKRAAGFMEAYNSSLLEFAGADEEFVYERLREKELSLLVAETSVADYVPGLSEEQVRREGICYVLVSTTGLRDDEGKLTPFSEEEVKRRTEFVYELCDKAREAGDLKSVAEAEDLTPIESSMGIDNTNDGQEPRMLDAARRLAVGEISDPIQTEEGWFLVQHTSSYDPEGTDYWREYLTGLAREERRRELYEEWKENSDIQIFEENMEQVQVKIVLKELL